MERPRGYRFIYDKVIDDDWSSHTALSDSHVVNGARIRVYSSSNNIKKCTDGKIN